MPADDLPQGDTTVPNTTTGDTAVRETAARDIATAFAADRTVAAAASDARVAGKVCLVTGANGGIGSAIVRRLLTEGAAVLATDLGTTPVAGLGTGSDRLRYQRHDVSDAVQWMQAVSAAEQSFGPVSVLVNVAGIIQWRTPILELAEADYRRVIDVNQVGTFLGMKLTAGSIGRAGGGSIVNFSSTAGLTGNAGMIAYVASKWAVRGMTKAAALEFGALNIRVNSVHPGRFDTSMTEGLPQPTEQPITGAGDLDDLAAMVLFLASDESRYCSGSEFVMDGGQLAGRMTVLGAAQAR